MSDPTPAELARKLRGLASSPAGWRGLYRRELADAADALDRLVALEASLTDEWGVRSWDGSVDGPCCEGVARDLLADYGPDDHTLVRRRVTPWEVADDGE